MATGLTVGVDIGRDSPRSQQLCMSGGEERRLVNTERVRMKLISLYLLFLTPSDIILLSQTRIPLDSLFTASLTQTCRFLLRLNRHIHRRHRRVVAPSPRSYFLRSRSFFIPMQKRGCLQPYSLRQEWHKPGRVMVFLQTTG